MLPESGRGREVADWIRKAKHDIDAAALIIESDASLTDLICFHAQQAAEKSLKAFLVSKMADPVLSLYPRLGKNC